MMSEQKPKEVRINKIQWALFLIAMLSLVVVFTGIRFQDISSYISEIMFPKADYIVDSWTTPTILASDFRESLSVSSEYFVVTAVNLKSDTPYQGEPTRLSFSFENKGKKSVEQPRVLVYFVDFMYRVWNVWNASLGNEKFVKGCSLEYYFPPIDQKVVGTWATFVLLYDDAKSVLVSYTLTQFKVTDAVPKPWWSSVVEFVAFFGGLIVVAFLGSKAIDFYYERKRLKRKREIKDEGAKK